MVDRPIIYDSEVPRAFDILAMAKDYMFGIGHLARMLVGGINTVVFKLDAGAQLTPSMVISLSDGIISQWSAADELQYSEIPADATMIMQMGYKPAGTLTLSTDELGSGQSQWVLIQASFQQRNIVRPGDPDGGVAGFWNSANPLEPFAGQNDNGQPLSTCRNGYINISAKYGTPATTGTEEAPAPDANNVGLYLINLTFGQTAITNGDIHKAGPNVGALTSGDTSLVPIAPFFPGLAAQHHLGQGNGQAPQIDLATEVAGILGLANLPASNTVGILSTLRFTTSNPNGVLAGKKWDSVLDTNSKLFYICTADGTTNWAQIGSAGTGVEQSSFPFTPAAGFVYVCDTSAGPGQANLDPAATYGNLSVGFKNEGNYDLTIHPDGEPIDGVIEDLIVHPGDFTRLMPLASGNKWSVIT